MAELEQFFRVLVQTLAGQNPARLHQPLAIGEVSRVLPYREARRHLPSTRWRNTRRSSFDSAPAKAVSRRPMPRPSRSSPRRCSGRLPDLGVIRRRAESHLVLRTEPMAEALNGVPEERYAPPEEGQMGGWADGQSEGAHHGAPLPEVPDGPPVRPSDRPTDRPEGASPPEFVVEHAAVIRCAFCGGVLPATRQINFCPHCGMGQDVGKCGKCGADVDVGWRYCVTCGEELHGVTS